MSATKTQHIILAPIPAYGHTRPLCALAARLAAETNVIITILMAPNFLKHAQSDIEAYFDAGHEALSRIRIVSLFDSPATQLPVLVPLVMEHYPAAYQTLASGGSVKCATTGKTFPAISPPVAVILDMFGIQQFQATRAISGPAVPVFTCITTSGGHSARMFFPESLGGQGDVLAKIASEAARLGKKPEEIGDQMFEDTDGSVVQVPGLPHMYDYEFIPQESDMKFPVTQMRGAAQAMLKMGDGLFVGISPAYDGETFVAMQDWARDTLHKPIFTVGPLLPPGFGEQTTSKSTDPRDAESQSFLDSMESKHGKNSVLFISLGSVFWPKADGQLEDLIDALLEKQFPFMLSYASPLAKMSDALLEKINASGIGLATKWAPQQFILTHPATGWFLTHAGHGSVTESLASGVPMICWPFEGDQAIAGVYLSQKLNVAFHLIEVRTGKGLQPLHSGQVPRATPEARRAEFREVLDQCRGGVGEEKRKNVKQMQKDLAGNWAPNGSSTLSVAKFLAEHTA